MEDLKNEDYQAYLEWLGNDGSASKENMEVYYSWLEDGGYEELFNDLLNETK